MAGRIQVPTGTASPTSLGAVSGTSKVAILVTPGGVGYRIFLADLLEALH